MLIICNKNKDIYEMMDPYYECTTWERTPLYLITNDVYEANLVSDLLCDVLDEDHEYDFEEDTGRLLIGTYNPNSKWDYFMEGGIADKLLSLKNGGHACECFVKDLNLDECRLDWFHAYMLDDGIFIEKDKNEDYYQFGSTILNILKQSDGNLKVYSIDYHI